MSILVVLPNWLGDTVMAIPALCLLRSLNPNDVLIGAGPPAVAEMLAGQPLLDRVEALDRGTSLRSQAQRLRSLQCRQAILLPNSFRSALIAALAGIPTRTGYRGQWRRLLLTDPRQPPANPQAEHHSLFYARLINPQVTLAELPEPRLVALDSDSRSVAHKLQDWGLADHTQLVAIHPGASYGSAKRWHSERFVETATRLATAAGTGVIFLGGPAEAGATEELARQCEHPACISAAGRLSLGEMLALLARCRVVVANDSGPMHIAAALGTPVVAIFGSTNPHWTAPRGAPVAIQHQPLECSPCYLRECPRGRECFDAITTQQVTQAALAYILSPH